MTPFYDYCVVAVTLFFCGLFIYSICVLIFNCSIYGRQKGIVALLIITYILTLFVNVIIILIILIHEILLNTINNSEHLVFYPVEEVIHVVGIYCVLWLNFMLNCIMISCWLRLLSDLFYSASKLFIKRAIYGIIIAAFIYLVIVIAVFVLTEMKNVLELNMIISILSYINLLPLLTNIIISLLCLCKLPVAQPIDLDIGLYERNTLCSCYTTVTRYTWSMIIIPISQSIYLILNILDIDLWSFEQIDIYQFTNIMITNRTAKIFYFVSQFLALLYLWNFLYSSMHQSYRMHTLLDVISGKIGPPPISKEVKINDSKKDDNYETLHELTTDEMLQPQKSLNDDTKDNIDNNYNVENGKEKEEEDYDIILQKEEKEEKEEVLIPFEPFEEKQNNMYTSDVDPEDNFKITQPLGEGAYGPVFAAIDCRDDEMVALKVMSFNPNDCDDLLSEINILRQCTSEFIVNFKDTFEKDDNLWLAMEYCDGGSILDVIQITKQTLTEKQCQCVLFQILHGLQYLHSKHLINFFFFV